MEPAELDQVVELVAASVRPVVDVVCIDEGPLTAPGEPAALVPRVHHAPHPPWDRLGLVRRGEDRAVLPADRAAPSTRRTRADARSPAPASDRRRARTRHPAIVVGEHVLVDVHHDLVPVTTRAGRGTVRQERFRHQVQRIDVRGARKPVDRSRGTTLTTRSAHSCARAVSSALSTTAPTSAGTRAWMTIVPSSSQSVRRYCSATWRFAASTSCSTREHAAVRRTRSARPVRRSHAAPASPGRPRSSAWRRG